VRRRPLALWLLALAGGCGSEEGDAPPLPLGKVAPTLPRLVRGRSLEEWLARAQAPEAALRAESPWALVELSADPAVLGPVLERLAKDSSADVRHAVIVAAGRLQGDLGPVLEGLLLESFVGPERGLAEAASGALLGRKDLSVALLVRALQDPSEPRARQAARLLGDIEPAPVGAAPALAHALTSAPMAVQLNAARALERLGAAALPALGQALAGAHGEGALALLGLIRAQGARAEAVLPALMGALSAEDATVARLAEETVVGLGAPALAPLDAVAAAGTPASPAAARAAARIREALPR